MSSSFEAVKAKATRKIFNIRVCARAARPYVHSDVVTFSAPMTKFTRMIDNMSKSFFITPTWDKIKKRIPKPRTE
jgi:hypothetical protein